jgi:hypothetical protein
MFRGSFTIGGFRNSVENKEVRLYRLASGDRDKMDGFISSIKNGVMAWDDANRRLLYRDENGDLHEAAFKKANAPTRAMIDV